MTQLLSQWIPDFSQQEALINAIRETPGCSKSFWFVGNGANGSTLARLISEALPGQVLFGNEQPNSWRHNDQLLTNNIRVACFQLEGEESAVLPLVESLARRELEVRRLFSSVHIIPNDFVKIYISNRMPSGDLLNHIDHIIEFPNRFTGPRQLQRPYHDNDVHDMTVLLNGGTDGGTDGGRDGGLDNSAV